MSTVYAGAAERRESIYDSAMKSRNGIGVSNVRAANDMINADITQRVTVDGSNATINTKVSIPANDDSFKRNTAKHAKNLLKGGAYGAGAAAAMKLILDGVGWVIDKGGKVKLKPGGLSDVTPGIYFCQSGTVCAVKYNSIQEAIDSLKGEDLISVTVNSQGWSTSTKYQYCATFKRSYGNYTSCNVFEKRGTATAPTQTPEVSDPQMEDAFYNWFKNNPQSITDPVTTYIYSPKDSQGNALPKSPEGSDPSFGPNEITDEMMENYMEHRDANLQNPYTTSIQDSTQTDTTQNPDGSKTTTTTNPDGSKTTTRTDTKTDPDTGEVTTTVTETTTMPDGSTSTKTETSTQTKPKPETTELPAFCEYAAILCTWINKDTEHKADEKSLWDKIKEFFDDTPDTENDDTEIEIEEIEKPTDKVQLPTTNSECPSLIYNFDLRTFKAQADFSPVWLCEIAEGLYYFFVGLGWYLSACILGWRSS